MPKDREAKKLISARIHPDNIKGLKMLAESTQRTFSSHVDEAVEEYLDQRSADEDSATRVARITSKEFFLDSGDLKRVTPVVEAMGKALTLRLFIDLVKALRLE